MKIKKITWQSRRDFTAIYICEHCDYEQSDKGYDNYFHTKVIPEKICGSCGKKSPEDYRPLTTKYPEGILI